MKVKWFSATHLENEELSDNDLLFSTSSNVPDWIHRGEGIFLFWIVFLWLIRCDFSLFITSSTQPAAQHDRRTDVRSLPAVVGPAVPVAVLAVPVRVLAVHWVRGPWRL